MKLVSARETTARIRLFWSECDRYRWAVLRSPDGAVVRGFTDFLDDLVVGRQTRGSPPKATKSQLEAATYSLLEFANFLANENISLARVCDKDLVRFRNAALASVRVNPRSRGSKLTASKTVNVKLRNVYGFLFWCQKKHFIPQKTLGWTNAPVRSSLPEAESRGSPTDLKDENKYPLIYEGVGENSRAHDGQYWATPDDIDRIEDLFWSQGDLQIAERNVLMMRIADHQGWRIESVNSLTTCEFSTSEFSRQKDNNYYVVSPPKQKLSREYHFEMSWELAHQIRRFIEKSRADLLARHNATEQTAKKRLFLSSKDANPLSDGSCVAIFADAFQSIGSPKGAGSHSFRRSRAESVAEEELARQIGLGLPIDRQAIVQAVKDVLGHASDEAQRAYDRALSRYRRASKEAQFRLRYQALELENDRLTLEVIALQRRLADLGVSTA